MTRLLLTLRYDGTRYHGWQVQPHSLTVQSVMQDAVETVTGVRSGITGCSRTDAGVHARMFCCTLDTESPLRGKKMMAALNANLPEDVAVYDCCEVPTAFHPRYSSGGKRYAYYIANGVARDPFLLRYALYHRGQLDEVSMQKTADLFCGRHDFSAFCSAGSTVEDKVRQVRMATVRREGEQVIFTVEADGFLYNMVRIMTGTLLDVETGRLTREDVQKALETGDRRLAGYTVPAQGLFLEKVIYQREVLAWPKKKI